MEDNIFESIDLVDLLKVYIQKAWIIILSALVCATAFLSYTYFFMTPMYKAQAELYVNCSANIGVGSELNVTYSGLQASRSLIDLYSVILKSRLTLEEVKEEAGLTYTYNKMKSMVSANSVDGTEVLRITAISSDPEEAMKIANTVVQVLPVQISKIIHGSSVEIVDLAVTPQNPYTPDYSKNTLIGFVIGVLVSALVIFILECFVNDTINSSDWLKDTFDDKVPLLAVVPSTTGKNAAKGYQYGKYGNYYSKYYYSSKNKSKKTAEGDTDIKSTDAKTDTAATQTHRKAKIADKLDFISSEAYNRLRSNLDFVCPKKEGVGKVIGITSANPREGKSYTSINLSYALAKNGYKILLVDGDMRRPSIAKTLEIEQNPGLSNILANMPEHSIRTGVLHPNLSIITSGDIPPNPSELIGSQNMNKLLQLFSEKYDYVVLDLPPINSVVDPITVSQYVDGMLLVVRHAVTKRRDVIEAMNQFGFADGKILGFVYNGFSNAHGYYRSGYKYGYGKYGYGKYGYGKYGYGKYGYGKYGYGYGYYGKSHHSGSGTKSAAQEKTADTPEAETGDVKKPDDTDNG